MDVALVVSPISFAERLRNSLNFYLNETVACKTGFRLNPRTLICQSLSSIW